MKDTISRNLKTLREANNFTQEQISEFIGIGRSAYANYESGEREIPLEVLEKTAALFGCELSLFFEEDARMVQAELSCAFRANNLSSADMREVSDFKNIVLNYLKMDKLLAE